MSTLETGGVVKTKDYEDGKSNFEKSASLDEAEKRRRTSRRTIIWIGLFLMITGGFCFHLSYLLTNYLQFHTFVRKLKNVKPFDPPKITICYPWYLSGMRFPTYTNIYPEKFVVNVSSPKLNYRTNVVDKNFQQFWRLVLLNTTNITGVDSEKLFSITSTMKLAFMREMMTTVAGPLFTDFVLVCSFNGHHCGLHNFTTHYFGTNVCFQFNPSDESYQLKNMSTPGLLVSVVMSMASIPRMDAESLYSYQSGKLFINQPDQFPSLESPQLLIPSDAYMRIQVTQTEVVKIKKKYNSCKLAKTFEICNIERDTNITCRNVIETDSLCQQMAVQKDLVNHCHCITTEMAIPREVSHFRLCHDVPRMTYINRGFIFNNTENKWMLVDTAFRQIPLDTVVDRSLIYERINCYNKRRALWKSIGTKSCTPICRQITESLNYYSSSNIIQTSITYELDPVLRPYLVARIKEGKEAGYPVSHLEATKVVADRKRKSITSNLPVTYLHILLNQTRGDVNEEVLRYGLENLFADIGGTLGLWAGASAITFLQLVDSFYVFIFARIKKRKMT